MTMIRNLRPRSRHGIPQRFGIISRGAVAEIIIFRRYEN